MMFNKFGFLLLLGFSCLFFCEGKIFPPSHGIRLTFIPGSTGRIIWSFDDDIKWYSTRTWIFKPSNGHQEVGLARIQGDTNFEILTTSYDIAAEKPATLVLKNVNLTYNGTYQFLLSTSNGPSDALVYIAVKPNATVFPSPIIANEGANVSCTCRGQGGNPPANVTWYKDNRKIGETGKEEKNLTLTNVINEKDNGSYKCVAQSHYNETFQDEVKVEVKVRYKPMKTRIEVPGEAHVGEKLVINCSSEGFPAPNFTITHNVTTNIISNHWRYTKNKVDHSDAGIYECIANNSRGNDTDSGKLIVKEKWPSTKSTPKKPTAQSTPVKTTVRTRDDGGGGSGDGLSTGAIAGICVAVLLLVVIVIVVYCCYKKKEKDGRNTLDDGRNRGNMNPNPGTHFELALVEDENAYEALVSPASNSESNTPEKDTPPPVYAAVDKENRQGNTLYASVDTDALKAERESKKEPAPQTEYASIDFARTAANAAKDEPSV